jgi:hypothetical protein
MLLETAADIGLDAPARAGRMMRFARTVRTRWRTLFLVTGAVLTVLGVVLASGAVLLPAVRPAAQNRIQRLHVRGPAGRVAPARVRPRPCRKTRRAGACEAHVRTRARIERPSRSLAGQPARRCSGKLSQAHRSQ